MTTEPAEEKSARALVRRYGWPLLIWALAIGAAVVGTRLLDGSDAADGAVDVGPAESVQTVGSGGADRSSVDSAIESDRPQGCPQRLSGDHPTRDIARGRSVLLVPLRAETAILCDYEGPAKGTLDMTATRSLPDVPGLVRDLNRLSRAGDNDRACVGSSDVRSLRVVLFTRANGSVQGLVIECGRADNGRRVAVLDEATIRRLNAA
ncbi:hypothetical protein [Streptomyces sp. SID3343]|uniref:hypothetical protein n=1 Tax=Streptomyces sp. SID3343 TaxID=2690260 RepID=UPI00136B4EA1|nr:hypothetical protein [Streptomyces sp. SID3343]MYW05914.1 hypothetical protein [Streptomyces sp. SID3343]